MEPIVKATSLELGYIPTQSIIHDGSVTINKGDFVFITGNSGSGKTTFVKSLYGGIRPRTGELEVCGLNIKKATAGKINALRRKMGVIFQDYKLIDEWTIEKNVMLPLIIAGYGEDVCEKQVGKLLTHVKLSHKLQAYPKELSGGEQQRAAVARALVHSPTLIVGDEPTGNLDGYSAEVVMNLFKTANNCGITVMVATHHIPRSFDIKFRHLHIEGKQIHELT